MKKIIKHLINELKKEKIVPIKSSVPKNDMFKGKKAFVVGGTGDIGREIAVALIRRGCDVCISGTNEGKIQNAIQYIVEQTNTVEHVPIKSICIDFSDMYNLEQRINEAHDTMNIDAFDIVVNCAGVLNQNAYWNTTIDEYESIMKINAEAVFFTCRVVAERMIRFVKSHKNEGAPHILIINSCTSYCPAWSPYEMSKWALRGFTLGLADMLIKYGIVVNGLAPGPVATKMIRQDKEDIYDGFSPIGRCALPSEVAEIAIVLLSDLGNMLVGDTYCFSGGQGVIDLNAGGSGRSQNRL